MYRKSLKFFTLAIVATMILSACNLASAPQGPTENEIAMAITLTLSAMELEAAQTQLAEAQLAAATEAPPQPTEAPAEDTTGEDSPLAATATPEPTPTIAHVMRPGNPPNARESGVTDANSSSTAAEGRALAGEDYSRNLFERPFTSESMQYRPDLDIIKTTLNRESEWVYVEIELQGQHPEGGLKGTYGFELDLDLDGRGDVYVLAENLQPDWSTDGVFAWEDSNNDVGGNRPILSDAPYGGNGYNDPVFEEGIGDDPDLVWARVDPANPKIAQLAYKYSLAKWDEEYLWWAVTDNFVKTAEWVDYNDHFTHEEAGSPLKANANYPLKALAEIDTTCRWSVGFTPTGSEPGLCYIAPPATPTPEIIITPTWTPEPVAQTGNLKGKVWIENSGNQVYDGTPDQPAVSRTISLFPGACGDMTVLQSTTSTNSSGDYGFSGLNVGTYCVALQNMGCKYQTPEQTVSIPAGGSATANFYCEPVQ